MFKGDQEQFQKERSIQEEDKSKKEGEFQFKMKSTVFQLPHGSINCQDNFAVLWIL
jgi:hypothetical protein